MFSLAQNYLTRGFWGDEAWTSLISQLPYRQMLKTTAADFHPPGYYTIVELWYKIFPATEISTRLISIVFYFLTGLMVYKLASFINQYSVIPWQAGIQTDPLIREDDKTSERDDKKNKQLLGLSLIGLLSALVVLLNPIFFRYVFEARNYTMFAFAATASIYFLLKFSTNPNIKNGLLFVLFTTLGVYTHYFMFFVLVSQGLYLLLFDRKILLKMTAAYFVAGVLYLGWIPFLLGQLKSVSGGYWIGGIDWRHTHYEAFLRILGGEEKNLFRPFLFSLSIAMLLLGLAQHIWKRSFERPYILIWLWAIIPFVLATLPGLTVGGFKFPLRPIFFWRYLIPAAIPLAMIMVHTAQKLPKLLFTASIGAIIVLSLAIDYLTFTSYPYNFKQAYSQKVLPTIKLSDKIVTVLPSFAEVLYYRNRNQLSNEIIVLPEGLVQFSGKSLLDAYVANGVVKISAEPAGSHFLLTPGPNAVKVEY